MRQASIFLGLIVAGVLLVVASFFANQIAPARQAWSDEQAEAYQQAAIDFHASTFSRPSDENNAKTAAAEAAYLEQRDQLNSARNRGMRIANFLRGLGVVSLLVGVVGAIRTKDQT